MNAMNMQAENLQLRAELEQLRKGLGASSNDETAGSLVRQILNHAQARNLEDTPNIDSAHRSQGSFDGDLFLIAKRPDGGAYVLLGDFSGSGLGAAIGALPVAQIFFSMSAKSLNVGEIAREINATLVSLLPEEMNFSASVIEMDGKGDRINLWSGGAPDVLWYEQSRGETKRIAAFHAALGSIPVDSFDAGYSRLWCRQEDSLLVHTKGLVNACNAADEAFGEARLEAAYLQHQEQAVAGVFASLDEFTAGESNNDDISLVQLRCKAR